MLNKALLIGNLGADPDTRYLPSGSAVTNFSVATTEKWKDKDSGEMKEATQWHRVSCFGRLAEICAEYLRKGSKVYIEGSIEYRKYEKDGVEKYATNIKAFTMKMLDGKPQGGQQQRSEPQPNTGSGQPGPDDFDDDIPF